jgi:hypothetical protein
MIEAEQVVADLNAALAADGEWIELWRETGTQKIPFKVRCRAFVRGYAAQELVGGIAQTDSKVIMSPTEILRVGWPGPNSSVTPTDQDRRVPRKGDAAVIAGRKRAVEAAGGIYLGGELVRIEMRVLG